jgi:hypothetical protein
VPLPDHQEFGRDVRNFRHYCTMDDGQIYFQDESIYVESTNDGTASTHLVHARTAWQVMPTPPRAGTNRVVGVVMFDSKPTSFLSDGSVWVFEDGEWHRTIPVPWTPARLEWEQDNGDNDR